MAPARGPDAWHASRRVACVSDQRSPQDKPRTMTSQWAACGNEWREIRASPGSLLVRHALWLAVETGRWSAGVLPRCFCRNLPHRIRSSGGAGACASALM
jgi:hypothetical protein